MCALRSANSRRGNVVSARVCMGTQLLRKQRYFVVYYKFISNTGQISEKSMSTSGIGASEGDAADCCHPQP